jgi:hypothetical protein
MSKLERVYVEDETYYNFLYFYKDNTLTYSIVGTDNFAIHRNFDAYPFKTVEDVIKYYKRICRKTITDPDEIDKLLMMQELIS